MTTGAVARRGLNALGFREGRRAARRGVLPSLDHQPLLRRLRPDTVVDVGANRGQFSLDVARAAPHARLHAFEPLAAEAALFRWVFAHTPLVTLHQVALGATAGIQDLHVSASRDSSSLLPIGDLQDELFPGTAEVGSEPVDVRTLDAFAPSLDLDGNTLLKIDVQGAELDVLAGAARSLEAIRWVYLEMSFVELYDGQPLASDVVAHLRSRGFNLTSLGRPVIRSGLAVQVDALFAKTR